MKSLKNLILFTFIGLLLVSCGASKKTSKGGLNGKTTPKNIIKTSHKQSPQFETLNAKLRGSYEDENSKQSVTLSLRVKKNDTIWISAQKLGFTLAKLLVTREGVQFYDKINQQYFAGDFSLLKKWLDIDLDYDNFQNLLFGQLLFTTNAHSYHLTNDEGRYTLEASQENSILQKISFDKQTLSLQEEYLKQPRKEDAIHIRYPSYFSNPDRNFPDKIYITASKPRSKINIQLKYRSLELNTPTRFPFSIPKGYTKIKTKK